MKLTQCTVPHLTTLWYNELDSKTLQISKQCSAVQCSAVQFSTMQCNAVHCSADSAA